MTSPDEHRYGDQLEILYPAQKLCLSVVVVVRSSDAMMELVVMTSGWGLCIQAHAFSSLLTHVETHPHSCNSRHFCSHTVGRCEGDGVASDGLSGGERHEQGNAVELSTNWRLSIPRSTVHYSFCKTKT